MKNLRIMSIYENQQPGSIQLYCIYCFYVFKMFCSKNEILLFE